MGKPLVGTRCPATHAPKKGTATTRLQRGEVPSGAGLLMFKERPGVQTFIVLQILGALTKSGLFSFVLESTCK